MSNFNKQIINNSIFSIVQIFIVTFCIFFLYKYIIQTIGIEKLGLWSLILSVTSLANIGNLGFTGSLVKFTAELSVEKNYKKINAILNSSIIGVSIISGILLSLVFLLGYNYIEYFVDEKWVTTSQDLLFYALISLYINIVASLYFSILEGVNLAYLRSIAFILATIIYVISSIIFINKYDIIGLAYAQMLQAFIFLILGVLLSIIYIKEFNIFYLKWHKNLMKKVFNYSVNFQMIGIAQMLYDPITKAILSKYGGLDFVAIFEMASKLVKQVRSITASILQNVVPKIVKLNVTHGKEKIIQAYKKINSINMLLIFTTLILIIPFSKIISIILLGSSNQNFIIVLISLSLGWTINTLNISSYMINLGTGNLKWNLISHLAIGILNLIFCISVGFVFRNGLYIIFSWILALILGSSLIIIEYHKRNKISFNIIFNKAFFQLMGYSMMFILIGSFINSQIENFILLLITQCILIFLYYFIIILKIKSFKKNIIYILKTKKNEHS